MGHVLWALGDTDKQETRDTVIQDPSLLKRVEKGFLDTPSLFYEILASTAIADQEARLPWEGLPRKLISSLLCHLRNKHSVSSKLPQRSVTFCHY